MSAFRTLRFLFSMERNRRMFKQLFPAELFETFIDVGHYNKDLKAYKKVVDKVNSLPVRRLISVCVVDQLNSLLVRCFTSVCVCGWQAEQSADKTFNNMCVCVCVLSTSSTVCW